MKEWIKRFLERKRRTAGGVEGVSRVPPAEAPPQGAAPPNELEVSEVIAFSGSRLARVYENLKFSEEWLQLTMLSKEKKLADAYADPEKFSFLVEKSMKGKGRSENFGELRRVLSKIAPKKEEIFGLSEALGKIDFLVTNLNQQLDELQIEFSKMQARYEEEMNAVDQMSPADALGHMQVVAFSMRGQKARLKSDAREMTVELQRLDTEKKHITDYLLRTYHEVSRLVDRAERKIYQWMESVKILNSSELERMEGFQAMAYALEGVESEHELLVDIALRNNLALWMPDSVTDVDQAHSLWQSLVSLKSFKGKDLTYLDVIHEDMSDLGVSTFNTKINSYIAKLLRLVGGREMLSAATRKPDRMARSNAFVYPNTQEALEGASGKDETDAPLPKEKVITPVGVVDLQVLDMKGNGMQIFRFHNEMSRAEKGRRVFLTPGRKGEFIDEETGNLDCRQGGYRLKISHVAYEPAKAAKVVEEIPLKFSHELPAIAGLVPLKSGEDIVPDMGVMPSYLFFGHAVKAALDAYHGLHSSVEQFYSSVKEFENVCRRELGLRERKGDKSDSHFMFMHSAPLVRKSPFRIAADDEYRRVRSRASQEDYVSIDLQKLKAHSGDYIHTGKLVDIYLKEEPWKWNRRPVEETDFGIGQETWNATRKERRNSLPSVFSKDMLEEMHAYEHNNEEAYDAKVLWPKELRKELFEDEEILVLLKNANPARKDKASDYHTRAVHRRGSF
ncbi:hypothetical protein [Aureibacter tunicatorum]|uniref:Uncharacterized protein n=1 Tax=Aureibacter tunicatorum TaxID=866807 RepID=A0AAE3XQE3_9BACT|nr:hypothetical protein [Aureibacter tunicatorum]MDR6240710.1 hypothetical protein [Aureibacter tunicatorum]BDD06957.1 hypothetical protein AUTU_44400 [Aureibacter tunicatorum]